MKRNSLRELFHEFGKNVVRVFSGRNLIWHLLAIGLTFASVVSGFDWFYFQSTRSPILRGILFPAVEIGAFIPLFGILLFVVISILFRKSKWVLTGLALGQTALLGWLISEAYKFFTGRPGPPGFHTQDFSTDISHVFRFGLGRGGVFFGWPSSHATIATAMAAALWVLFPKNKAIKFLSAAYALYVGLGVSATIHWFSDFAAGLVIGALIGAVVGKSFRNKITSELY